MSEHDEDILFQVPIPPGAAPPFPPVPSPAPNMIYVRHREVGVEGEREHEDLMLRKVPRDTAMQFRAAAGGRGLTHAQYLSALTALHESMRGFADEGDERLQAELERLGLTTVTV